MNRISFKHIGIVLIGFGFVVMATGNVFHNVIVFVIQETLGAALVMIGFIKALSKQKEKTRSTEKKPVFDSVLPAYIDWDEINEFLRNTVFYKQLLWDTWRNSDCFTAYPISDASIDCLRCLHEDLCSCYGNIFAFDENGNEDRQEEYRLLRENLRLKYGKIEEGIRDKIYCHYLQEDR